ncbi:uncharacterized protein ASCRUDRAFT_76241 [Ascoidea rubescens DSM 1968]|uniref:Uncharacterized protein n=1 Tax=Ascoidea rubescens DSM 1968 TaxID=1344418 RepID=A0A1D2VH59_9ASCO|nr:hypothetical protein ASCRUDRAFT_76241 [Ascoidea rubescens DSM 1968]ODV60890.1 hypothetical protein ASCRUDRAFT_76241 [Ascoidea rubescens DSM 1968]
MSMAFSKRSDENDLESLSLNSVSNPISRSTSNSAINTNIPSISSSLQPSFQFTTLRNNNRLIYNSLLPINSKISKCEVTLIDFEYTQSQYIKKNLLPIIMLKLDLNSSKQIILNQRNYFKRINISLYYKNTCTSNYTSNPAQHYYSYNNYNHNHLSTANSNISNSISSNYNYSRSSNNSNDTLSNDVLIRSNIFSHCYDSKLFTLYESSPVVFFSHKVLVDNQDFNQAGIYYFTIKIHFNSGTIKTFNTENFRVKENPSYSSFPLTIFNEL